MSAQLALALLALGRIKTGVGAATGATLEPAKPSAATAPAKDSRDRIALLSREWLSKR